MKGINSWSYHPYRPFLTEIGHPYISRIAPEPHSIHLEWEAENAGAFRIFFRIRGTGAWHVRAGITGCAADLTGLETDTDYEFYVCEENAPAACRSRIRLAHTGSHVGVTVNYLHPEDNAYAFSGHALCSPSLILHPDGYLLASMDLYAGGAPQNLTLIYRSDDRGATWHYVSELFPCFWGKMFLYEGALYMLAVTTEYGDLVIGRSTDGGRTFSAPVTLLRGSNGKAGNVGVHKNPQKLLSCKGRLYETLEWGSWSNDRYYHAPMVMSIREGDDPLIPENWHFTEPLVYDPAWPGTAAGPSRGNIEGTLAVDPSGRLLNIMRYEIRDCVPDYGRVLSFGVDTEDPDAPLVYDHAIAFPANHSKFTITRDAISGKYLSIASRILDSAHKGARTLLSLMVSDDLEHWECAADLIDYRDADPTKVGFQYVDFEIDGDDLIYLCRTAMNGAANFHDANYSTFHRLEHFRRLLS